MQKVKRGQLRTIKKQNSIFNNRGELQGCPFYLKYLFFVTPNASVPVTSSDPFSLYPNRIADN
jgi:hypothetical protein